MYIHFVRERERERKSHLNRGKRLKKKMAKSMRKKVLMEDYALSKTSVKYVHLSRSALLSSYLFVLPSPARTNEIVSTRNFKAFIDIIDVENRYRIPIRARYSYSIGHAMIPHENFSKLRPRPQRYLSMRFISSILHTHTHTLYTYMYM